MFLSTLNVSEKLVDYTLSKAEKVGSSLAFSTVDERGRHIPHNKTPDNLLEGVRQHINSFPRMDPHYTRTDTNRQFQDQT